MENKIISTGANESVLNYLIRKPVTEQPVKKAIILLHGVGSNEQDLFSLADQFPADYYILSARGPFTLSSGRYAWYNVSFATGKPVFDADQEVSSRSLILTFIDEMKKQYQLDDVYLGGFSQGAIMSYSIGLTHPETVTGIFSIGGRILDEIKPLVKKDHVSNALKVFIAHGIQDNILPIFYAKEAKHYLDSLNITPTYYEYNIGHQITPAILGDLKKWLGK